jgi:hypothetical protein
MCMSAARHYNGSIQAAQRVQMYRDHARDLDFCASTWSTAVETGALCRL